MSKIVEEIFEKAGGEFVSSPALISEKLSKVKAILFDWDGVFNDGTKRGTEGSIFSEVDSMGTNLLRYAFWKQKKVMPVTAVITGENNPSSQFLAKREHFHEVFLLSKNKGEVFKTFCRKYELQPHEVLFFFDDVLDLDVARQCGVRIMIQAKATGLLQKFARDNSMADYITGCQGNNFGLREGCELVIALLGLYEEVVSNRMVFSPEYQTYVSARQAINSKTE